MVIFGFVCLGLAPFAFASAFLFAFVLVLDCLPFFLSLVHPLLGRDIVLQ
jgi:hypothetical protein